VITAAPSNITPSNGTVTIAMAFSASLTGTVKIQFLVT
jgi:hypothetical protein